MLIQDYLIDAARHAPDKTLLFQGESRFSYGDVLRAAQGVAARALEAGLEPGFRGAILSDDPREYLGCYFGILMAGGVVVGLNTQTTVKALTHVLQDSGASLLCAQKKFARLLKDGLPSLSALRLVALSGRKDALSGEAVDCVDLERILEGTTRLPVQEMPFRSSCDLAQIIYTSGTTGAPKGVMLRHSALAANTASIISYLKLSSKDRIMAVLPFFYSYGNSVMLTHVAVGGSMVVNQSFLYPNVILQQMVDHRVTGFSGVPSTFAILLNRSAIRNFRFPHLRYLTQAGAAMTPALAEQLQSVFPGTDIFIMYGQTEAAARLAYLDPKFLFERRGSIGRAIPGVQLTLRDKIGREVPVGETGEIVARGENIMAGYWGHPGETARVLRPEGLWTGDLARQDEDGFFYIVSRKSDIIKCGSHRIGPLEIEEVLAAHPKVREAAVVGVPDAILDERIRACVVSTGSDGKLDKELIRYCRRELPAYKVPHEIILFSELPKTATGKIKKTALREE